MLNFIGPIEWNNSGTKSPYCSTCDFGVCPPAFPALTPPPPPWFTGDGTLRGTDFTHTALFGLVGIWGANPAHS